MCKFQRLLLTNCLSVFDHFVGLALKGLSTLEPGMDVQVGESDKLTCF